MHGYALSLELMGIAPLGPAVELSFSNLNHSLTHATTELGRTGRLEKTELGAVEVIKQDYGVWAVQGYHMHIGRPSVGVPETLDGKPGGVLPPCSER